MGKLIAVRNQHGIAQVQATGEYFSPTELHYSTRGLHTVLMMAMDRDSADREQLAAMQSVIRLMDEMLTLDEFQMERALE